MGPASILFLDQLSHTPAYTFALQFSEVTLSHVLCIRSILLRKCLGSDLTEFLQCVVWFGF